MPNTRLLEVVAIIVVLTAATGATTLYLEGTSSGQTSVYCGGGTCSSQGISTTPTAGTSSGSSSTTQTVDLSSTMTTRSTSTTFTITRTTTTTTSSTTNTSSSPALERRLGFWLQEADVLECIGQGGYDQCGSSNPAKLFFNSMFLTPPYPSSLEVMIFAILQAQTNGEGCSSSSYISSSESFWGNLAQLADPHPNIQLVYEIAFNSTSPVYGVSCFRAMASYFGHYSSVYGIGVEGEYTPTLNATIIQSAMSAVTSQGKKFINYYVSSSLIPSGGYDIKHTNFPGGDAGGYDQVNTLTASDSDSIGIDSGYYYPFPFPGSVSCPIGLTAMNSTTAGWNKCVEQTELSVAVQQPASTRQFVELDVASTSSGSFTGVSGLSTSQLWDNPTLRNWIWTDPNYAPNFVLST
jgi:hypothetical protein